MKSLKIVLIGYGKMGHVIEEIALRRGHKIILTIDKGQEERFEAPLFQSADVAIEFTSPQSAYANCMKALDRGLPVVSGSTGWGEHLPELKQRCEEEGKTFFWSSNFSIGVYLFRQITARVAHLMQAAPDYKLSMSETHHVHKLDAPSGTAITLAETVLAERPELKEWILGAAERPDQLPIVAYREGEVPGIHSLSFRSEVDKISLTHEAYGREGFALGAVLAAEYAAAHQGWLTMDAMLDLTK